MAYRIAKSLDKLRSQVNAANPGRSKKSDGWIGDAAHRNRQSEHNPDANGVVRALDITHDPAHGVYARELAEAIVKSRDPRVLYIISNGEIVRSYARTGTTPWKWAPYNGANPHNVHVHFSVVGDPRLYDSVKPWALPIYKDKKEFKGITATWFNDPKVAYPDVKQGYADLPGCAVPFRFSGTRPKFLVTNPANGASVLCPVVDVGPWYIDDPWWVKGTRPRAEVETIIKSGPNAGKKSNKAGIDLTPAAAKAIGLKGKGLVNVELVE